MIHYMRLVLILALIVGCSSSNGPDDSAAGAIEGPSAAPGFTLVTLTGNQISLSDYKGKVVYIFFVGYSCPPCIASGPATEQIFQKYKSEEFQAIAVDVWDGGPGQVAGFRSNTGISYPICLDGSKTGSSYGVSNDFSVIIDKEGNLKYKASGVNKNSIESIIDSLL
jgi:peroxiredoxin